MVNPLSASNAYQNLTKLVGDATSDEASNGGGTGGPSFAQMVGDALKGAADTQYKSEATQLQSMTGGKVEISDLVTAVSNAELSLSTVVAVRDRVINAYQDIIKMTI